MINIVGIVVITPLPLWEGLGVGLQYYLRMIQPITLANSMIPGVAALIEGVEALLNLLKTNAMTAMIATRLREVCIDDVAPYLGLCGYQFY